MNLIAAVDKNWAIGLANKLLVSIPNDQKFFREYRGRKPQVPDGDCKPCHFKWRFSGA